MSTAALSGHRRATRRSRRLDLVVAVLATVAATGLVWLIAKTGLGPELYQPGFGGSAPQSLSIWWTAIITGVTGLAGWGVLAIIERFSRRPAQVWLVVSVGLLALSLGGPLSGDGIGTSNRLALVLMHLTAGATLIPLLFRSARLGSQGHQ